MIFPKHKHPSGLPPAPNLLWLPLAHRIPSECLSQAAPKPVPSIHSRCPAPFSKVPNTVSQQLCPAAHSSLHLPKRKVWHRAIRLQDLSCLRSLQWPPLSASVPFSLSCLAPSPFLLSPHASRTAMAPAKQLTIMFKTKRETEKNRQRDKTKCIPSPDTKQESTSSRHG